MKVLNNCILPFDRLLLTALALICCSCHMMALPASCGERSAALYPFPDSLFLVELSSTSPPLLLRGRPAGAPVSIYSLPYSPALSVPDWRRLWTNTATLLSAGGIALGVLKALPQNSTAWSRLEEREVPMGTRWLNHVKEGPVWDHDNMVFNYILHPYGGAAYYMSARSCGFNIWGSFLYSFCVSTFFWEYGVEAFMEVPSVQDLVITPVIGSLFGEGFYQLKRMIVDRGYRVLGCPLLGHFCTFLLDPVNEVVGLFYPDRRLKAYAASRGAGTDVGGSGLTVASSPFLSPAAVGLTLSLTF